MFGAVMARRRCLEKVDTVDLWRCGIDDNLVDVIVQNLKGFKVQVRLKFPFYCETWKYSPKFLKKWKIRA